MTEIREILTCQVLRDGVKCEHQFTVNAFAVRRKRAVGISSCGCLDCLNAFMKTVDEMVCDDWAFFAVCFNGVPIPGLELEGVPVVNLSHVRLN